MGIVLGKKKQLVRTGEATTPTAAETRGAVATGRGHSAETRKTPDEPEELVDAEDAESGSDDSSDSSNSIHETSEDSSDDAWLEDQGLYNDEKIFSPSLVVH